MKKRSLKIVLILIILCLMACVVILALKLEKTKQIEMPVIPDYEGSQGEYIPPNPGSVKRSQNITLPGWDAINIKAGETNISEGLRLRNPAENIWYECSECGEYLSYASFEQYLLDYPDTHLTEKDFNGLLASGKMHCEHCDKDCVLKEETRRCYYMCFELYLGSLSDPQSATLLYKSGLVAPGNFINKVILTRPIEEGEYEGYVVIRPYKDDKITQTNTGTVGLLIKAR